MALQAVYLGAKANDVIPFFSGRYKKTAFDRNIVADELDLFSPDPMPGGETRLGQHSLSAEEHTFTVKILGKNNEAKPEYMFGLDYIRFEKAAQTQ